MEREREEGRGAYLAIVVMGLECGSLRCYLLEKREREESGMFSCSNVGLGDSRKY